jgi:hypothetical protein
MSGTKKVAQAGVVLLPILFAYPAFSASDAFVRYEVERDGNVRIVTEVIVKSPGASSYRHQLAPGSNAATATAVDRASGKPLTTRVQGGTLVVDFGRSLNEKAEQRVGVEEHVARGSLLQQRGPVLNFAAALSPGRSVIVLPAGYIASRVSIAAQVASGDNRVKIGIINATKQAMPVEVEMRPGGPGSVPLLAPNFRAEDDRAIVYWLADPKEHRIDLAIDMCVTQTGQTHAYSVLRKEDNITNAKTVDLDRGIELPTRILSGSDAAALGDNLTFPADASVFVADLGYRVPAGGSARVRLFQTATDPAGYRLLSTGEFQWDRFVARLHTRVVLPDGWVLTSVDQPAVISQDERGRVVLDFVETSGDSEPTLLLTARKADAQSNGR